MVKMTKCRRCAHHCTAREVVADTPTVTVSKLTPGDRSSSAQREKRYGILNGPGFERFAGDYD